MAIVVYNADEMAAALTTPPGLKTYGGDTMGKIRHKNINFLATVAGDIGSTVNLGAFPPGRIRLLFPLSRLAWSAFGALRTLDIGHRAYDTVNRATTGLQTVEAAAPAVFDDDIDVATAGAAAMGSDMAEPKSYVITSQKGFTLFATVAGGTIPINATLKGWFAFVAE